MAVFKSKTIEEKINSVQHLNDPTTLSDEIIKIGGWAMWILLIFSAFLSSLSYFKLFEGSFGFLFSALLSLCISLVIELGKNWGYKKWLRMAFFHGKQAINSSADRIIVFLSMLLLSAACFWASVYNSTIGARQLSNVLQFEKTEKRYTPTLSKLDSLIEKSRASIETNQNIKWKGVVTYQAQKAINSENLILADLIRQKESQEKNNREDFERSRSFQDSKTSFSAENIMLIGGLVELLQVLILLAIVASEKSLVSRHFYEHSPQNPVAQSPQQKSATTATKTGFYDKRSAEKLQNPVAQSPQHFSETPISPSDAILKNFKKKMQTEIPNLNRGDANPATVFARISKELDFLNQQSGLSDFKPTLSLAEDCYNYLDAFVFRAISNKGFDYPNQDELLQKIRILFL